MRAWVACLGVDVTTTGEELAGALVERGLELAPSVDPSTPGVLLFEPGVEDLEATLEEVVGPQRNIVVAVSYRREVDDPWPLLERGAEDVLAWIDDPRQCAVAIAHRLRRSEEVHALLSSQVVSSRLVGRSDRWRKTVAEIVEIARFSTASILLVGESGTGKELLARLVHDLDPRQGRGDLVTLDCTTIVPSLSGSELFGHEKGAYTGAAQARLGAFARANGGTLFLDEVGELPPPLQAELLRVLQEGMYKPVGSDHWRSTSFRLVCATHRDLGELQEEGLFRRDLYHRLATFTVTIPALRDRVDDIDDLAAHFFRTIIGPDVEVSSQVKAYLRRGNYPGNVRDLRHLVERIAYRHVGPTPVSVGDIPYLDRPAASCGAWPARSVLLEAALRHELDKGTTLKTLREDVSAMMITLAMEAAGGNLRHAASRLGVTERALQLRRATNRQLTLVAST